MSFIQMPVSTSPIVLALSRPSAPSVERGSALQAVENTSQSARMLSRIGRLLIVAETFRLESEQARVPSVGSDQLVMGAELDNATMLDHGDAIGVACRREPMRD